MPLLEQNLSSCPDGLEEVLEQIATALGKDVVVESVEDDWVRFRVVGLTDWCAVAQIDLAKDKIFGSDMCDYQVLCSAKAPHGSGLWIQELEGSKRDEFQAGVWQY